MSAYSPLDDVLNAVTTTIQGLGIMYNNVFVPVVKRKLPKREEAIDPSVQITVCGAELVDSITWISFGIQQVSYLIQITIISPNNADQSSNIGLYTQWRRNIQYAFSGPYLAGASTIFDMNVLRGDFLNREEINNNYDYQQLNIEMVSAEPVTLT